MNAVLVAVVVAAALVGAPLFAVIAAGAMLGFHIGDVDLQVIAIELYRLTDTSVLLALPLFTFAGYLLSESNTSHRLVRVTQAFMGWMPGGLALVALLTCALFTAFTGASGVTIVAIGAMLLPALREAGYNEKFSMGLVTTSGSLGLLLPPALPLIIYGVVVQQMGVEGVTLEALFIAGILPALLMIFALWGYSLWANRGAPIPLHNFTWAEARAALWEARWELPLPVVVLGGIYGGWFVISEAAAVTALYALVVEVFLYREIPLRKLPRIMRDAMVMVGGVLIIMGMAMAFTNYLVDASVPERLFEWIHTWVDDKLTFLLLLNVLLLLLGAMLDIFAALIIMIPLLLPVAMGYGVDPVHLGIIFLANMQIGYFTPPVGMNLFIASIRFKKPIAELWGASLPFFLVLLAAVLVITYVPWLSLAFIR
ncbi:MAG: TRAP transporter large permease [Gammaproteobacteria bacterium]